MAMEKILQVAGDLFATLGFVFVCLNGFVHVAIGCVRIYICTCVCILSYTLMHTFGTVFV